MNKEQSIVNRVVKLLERDRLQTESHVADGKMGYSYLILQDEQGEAREIKLTSNSFVTGVAAGRIG